MEIPQQLRDMAEAMGVDIDTLLQQIEGGQQQQQAGQDPAAAAAAASASGIPAAGGAVQVQGSAEVPGEVRATPGGEAETNEERLARELAVTTQQLQQTQAQLQAHQGGRVVGSGGLSGPVPNEPPTLAEIEPGIRYAVRNGLIPAETLREKFGDTIVELFLNDQGGAI